MRSRLRVLAFVLVLAGCKQRPVGQAQDAGGVGVTHTLNGLLVIQAPAPFELTESRGNLVTLQAKRGPVVETLTIVASKDAPATLDAFAAPFEGSVKSAHPDYATHMKEPAKCLREDGLRIAGTWKEGGTEMYRNTCYFFHAGHAFLLGYSLAFDVPTPRRVELEAILERSTFAP